MTASASLRATTEGFDPMIQSGPCTMCGTTNYSLSYGGPGICPSCDCGIDPEVSRLRFRVAVLEAELAEARRAK